MANPAPTLNQINAFNATVGTTIDFNIIGGTEVIRSNKIYIYDLSDNSLICTHLYVSTESIHELPPNTSSSIVYASGKSSADFTNNTQYYAQIQTFTDTNGTQGASGLSVAKLFWCLPTPTLTLGTIPTTISTTSYNVSATYTPNTSGGATNEIQEFQFNLYSAIGALLQTSGVVLYGDGVELSYNFSGLEVNSTYYVTLDVTTTQGMNVSAQSNTFTVSIDTPTMGSASVVNNACDGYISVTSNLSTEYSHEQSVDAGEVMSFTTDSPNDIKELQVDFHPIQDGTPWMSSTPDTTPYLFRASPQLGHSYNSKFPTIVGGSVVGNQLVQVPSSSKSKTENNVTITDNRDGTYSVQTTSEGASATTYLLVGTAPVINNHIYLFCGTPKNGSATTYRGYAVAGGVIENKSDYGNGTIQKATANGTASIVSPYIYSGAVITTPIKFAPQFIDLTAMLGSAIADRAYTMEQSTAGSGIAWLKSYGFIKDGYTAFDAGSIQSVEATKHVTRGFNQWDEEWELGYYDTSTGAPVSSTTQGRGKNYIRVVPNTEYYASKPANKGNLVVLYYDANKNYLSQRTTFDGTSAGGSFTTPSNCAYIRFFDGAGYGTTYNSDICINISDPAKNGTYEPYVSHEYALDSDLVLRGIPKVDANDNIYYDGDIYHSDGKVDRRYGIVDLGTLTWNNYKSGGFNAVLSGAKNASGTVPPNAIDSKALNWQGTAVALTDGMATITGGAIYIVDANFTTDATAFTSAMSGVYLVYEKATPTTETADPFQSPMLCDPSGTEEWVTANGVPVGQSTTYADIYPISGWTGCEVDVSGVNVWSEQWELGTIDNSGNDYASTTRIRSKGHTSVLPSTTYYLKSALSTQLFYYDANKTFISAQFKTDATFTTPSNAHYIRLSFNSTYGTTYNNDVSVNYPSTDTSYHAYNGEVYNITWQTEAGTVYGGTVDVVSGLLTVDRAMVDLGTLTWSKVATSGSNYWFRASKSDIAIIPLGSVMPNMVCSHYETLIPNNAYVGNTGVSQTAQASYVVVCDMSYSDATAFTQAMNGVQLVYELANPIEISLTPQQMQTLSGQNNIWSNTNGGMSLIYQLPITSLLVKRRDVADVSGKWLTLYSVPITQASDMDFTFIDFLNQYGKTYQYALVPVLAQDQSGVIVQIEGGYTTSDTIDSIFDGVYIADQTNVERVKAGAGYGNIEMNQSVGTIVPIGSKYPIVVTNSQNQYHNGSIRGKIVPNDFYSNGNLSRIDMVNKRDELEQFLTNKRAKIIKDWNGKIWLVMILSNVDCTFDDNYGMGMVEFSADWVEIGDPTIQQDLYNAGLINVGGV